MSDPMRVTSHPRIATRFTRLGDDANASLPHSRRWRGTGRHGGVPDSLHHEFSVEELQPQRLPAADNSGPVRAGFNLERNHQ
jgi:hypothetical protein